MKTLCLAGIALLFSVPSFADSVDYTTVANGTYSSVSLGGTTVTGSSGSIGSGSIGSLRGLGTVGGGSNVSIDSGETLTIAYGGEVNNVTVSLVDVEPVGNSSISFTAFDGATSLGLFTLPTATTAPETFDLSSFISNHELTSVVFGGVPSSPPIGFQLTGTSFTPVASPVPEPSSLVMLGTGIFSAAGLRFRRKR